jgi:hypothetical protein
MPTPPTPGTPSPDRRPGIDALVARFEADERQHMRGLLSTAAEIQDLESRIGSPLPEAVRQFLLRLGGGVYYMRHEIFGSRRVMIHDIELVPVILSFREWLGVTGSRTLPIHRADGRVHVIELGSDPAPVFALDGGTPAYRDFTAFLDAVVKP